VTDARARARRAQLATEAAVTARLAGHAHDPWLAELAGRYVAGEVTVAGMRAALDALYPQPNPDPEEPPLGL